MQSTGFIAWTRFSHLPCSFLAFLHQNKIHEIFVMNSIKQKTSCARDSSFRDDFSNNTDNSITIVTSFNTHVCDNISSQCLNQVT